MKKCLKSKAKGWFVLRLVNDYLNTVYDLSKGFAEDAIKSIESNYKILKLYNLNKLII